MDTPKRHHLTIHQKLRIIEESKKPGFNRKDAMEKYRISKASLSRVLKSQTNKLQESKNTKGFNLNISFYNEDGTHWNSFKDRKTVTVKNY